MPWSKLCNLSDLIPGEGKYIEIGGSTLAVFLHDDEIHVIDNYCPHAGGNLAGGYIDCSNPTLPACVVCPWHGWAFRLDNGNLIDSPAVKVAKYETRIVDGVIEVDLIE